jgi:citrate lyase subunit beta-like protein
MGMIRTPSAKELLYARSHIATHARAFGLDAIGTPLSLRCQQHPLDMVCIDFKDPAKLTEEAEEGARMGFTGKQAIHPAQVKIICDSFKPPEVR